MITYKDFQNILNTNDPTILPRSVLFSNSSAMVKPLNWWQRFSFKSPLGISYKPEINVFFFHSFSFFFFCHFRATPTVYGSSQARGWIKAVATGLHHSHSNIRSKPRLRPTPQLTATLDPWPIEQGQGSNLSPHGCKSDSFPLSDDGNSWNKPLSFSQRAILVNW